MTATRRTMLSAAAVVAGAARATSTTSIVGARSFALKSLDERRDNHHTGTDQLPRVRALNALYGLSS